jgi:putative salt-induced outer membrane protein YdiY
MRRDLTRLLTLAVFSLLCLSAHADEVRLKNGDIITGNIVKKETEVLVVNTSYAGDISIQWSEIATVKSEKPVHVVLTSGKQLRGPLLEDEPGVASVELAEADVSANKAAEDIEFDLREVRYINPTPDLTGEGIRWTGNINAGGSATQGNTETKSLRIDGETIVRTLKNRYNLRGEFNRAEDRGEDTQYNSIVRGKYDRFFTEQWYGYVNTTLENDRFRDLRLRRVFGLGNGYQIYETPNINLSVEGGLNHINEDYYEGEDDSYPGLRWALNYDQLVFNGKVRLFHNHETLVGFQETSQILFYSRTGLRFPLVFNLNASTQINYDWMSDPADGREKADKALIFTLGYGW